MMTAFERVLIDEHAIAARLNWMAGEITEYYRNKPLTVVAVLNGSLLFAADLLRRIPLPLKFDCLRVASYEGGTESSGVVTFLESSLPILRGREVLLVDDILDSGLTLQAIRQRLLREAYPAGVRMAVLLRKRKTREFMTEPDYVGFDIGDEFVVGYGLDYRGKYRNLPSIGVLSQAAIAEAQESEAECCRNPSFTR